MIYQVNDPHRCETCGESHDREQPVKGGHWQKEVPSKSGQYWTATRDGLSAGLRNVVYDNAGKLVWDGAHSRWAAWWWWSEPVVPPAPPAKDEWEDKS